MLRAKENGEFDKWWQLWISTLAQGRIAIRRPTSGNESGDDLECTAEGTHKAAA
jgi:hypothetical protein